MIESATTDELTALLAVVDAGQGTLATVEHYYRLARALWEGNQAIEIQHIGWDSEHQLRRMPWVGGWFGKPLWLTALYQRLAAEQAGLALNTQQAFDFEAVGG